jgi:hypothetical protein
MPHRDLRAIRVAAAVPWAALALLAAGCGAASPGGPTAASGGAGQPGATPSVILTMADSGRAVRLATGQTAALRLPDRDTWSDPQASGDAVRVTRGRDDHAAGYDEWIVVAARPGTATITSQGRLACPTGTICPGPIIAFSVTVAVS